MSDTPQGPGWWVASDGKYYPPEPAATPQPPPPPLPPPIPGPSAPAPAATPPKQSGGKGCLYAIITLAVLAFLGIMGAIAAVFFLGSKAADTIQDAAEQKECPFLSDQAASDALGQKVDAADMSGFTSLVGIATDNRLLSDAPSCVLYVGDEGAAARVARYQGGDASGQFQEARDIADGTRQDQGNGLSLSTEPFVSEQTVTMGDEAFCTTADPIGASGVLVRQGDTVVYVSLQSGTGSSSTQTEQCASAQEVAGKILG